MNNKGVCRRAPATPGLLNTLMSGLIANIQKKDLFIDNIIKRSWALIRAFCNNIFLQLINKVGIMLFMNIFF